MEEAWIDWVGEGHTVIVCVGWTVDTGLSLHFGSVEKFNENCQTMIIYRNVRENFIFSKMSSNLLREFPIFMDIQIRICCRLVNVHPHQYSWSRVVLAMSRSIYNRRLYAQSRQCSQTWFIKSYGSLISQIVAKQLQFKKQIATNQDWHE